MTIDFDPRLAHVARSVANRNITSFLDTKGYLKHRAAIESALSKHLPRWGAHGFRVVGKSPKLRLEVLVARTVQTPRNAVEPIDVGGFRLKPKVVSSGVEVRRERRADGSANSAIGAAHAIAPGARVRVGRGSTQEFVGIAAVLSLKSGPALLTCGHAAAFSFSAEILAGDEPNGDAIATLDANLLELSAPLDAAICPLTDTGVALLGQSSSAPTWRFQGVRRPSAVDNQCQTVFWQTHDGDDEAPTAPVLSFSATNTALFGARGPRAGFIETHHDVVPGDSGSLLSFGPDLYGICSGFVGFTALFTPIQSVLDYLGKTGKKCSIYRPSAS